MAICSEVGRVACGVNLAIALARHVPLVVLWDLTASASATMWLAPQVLDKQVSPLTVENILLVPSHPKAQHFDMSFDRHKDKRQAFAEDIQRAAQKALVVLYTEGYGELFKFAVRNAQAILVPITPWTAIERVREFFSGFVWEFLKELKPVRFVLCHGLVSQQQDAVAPTLAAQKLGAHLMKTIVHTDSKMLEAQQHHKSIFAYAPNSKPAKDYDALAKETLAWLETLF